MQPASENAQAIYDSYMLILFVTGFVFVLVEATLVVFLVRYRRGNRPREAEGPQVRGHTRIEVAWTIVPVLLLTIIVGFVFVKLPKIEDAPGRRAGRQPPGPGRGSSVLLALPLPGR